MLKTFLTGAVGYPALELMTRGRTHPSMALAGGTSMLLIRQAAQMPFRRRTKALLCGAGITAIEYGCGCLWNKDHRIWDYRKMPLNWEGQVCLPYSLLWSSLSYAVLLAYKRK